MQLSRTAATRVHQHQMMVDDRYTLLHAGLIMHLPSQVQEACRAAVWMHVNVCAGVVVVALGVWVGGCSMQESLQEPGPYKQPGRPTRGANQTMT
jgi:hypothetical protein